jgi:hypothetical protein
MVDYEGELQYDGQWRVDGQRLPLELLPGHHVRIIGIALVDLGKIAHSLLSMEEEMKELHAFLSKLGEGRGDD